MVGKQQWLDDSHGPVSYSRLVSVIRSIDDHHIPIGRPYLEASRGGDSAKYAGGFTAFGRAD
jgi:hypothetical protein